MSVVLVTGASSGIGASIADVSDKIVTWAGDLAESEDCDELIADTIDEFGQIDCLVNNAGILIRGSVEELSDEDWRHTMTVNLDVPFFLSRAALPYLLQTEGSIVNIASDWGLSGGERAASYCASKGGLVLLTKAMAKDHARDGLRVNAVCPGDVDTPMLAAEAKATGMDIDDYLEEACAAVPSGRVADPEEVASLTLFLASDAATHINGATILIDGGASA
jgi:NAD(P)-dependent dehydrogenase (short-subunit alcohol dehydrogenase family)